MSTATEARPDLSALDRETRICIAVAETQSAAWVRADEFNRWHLIGETAYGPGIYCVVWDAGYGEWDWRGPNYLTDPAAWGALLEKEGVWPFPVVSDGTLPCVVGWRGGYVRVSLDDDSAPSAHLVPNNFRECFDSPGEAVVMAVLAKHGVPVPE